MHNYERNKYDIKDDSYSTKYFNMVVSTKSHY